MHKKGESQGTLDCTIIVSQKNRGGEGVKGNAHSSVLFLSSGTGFLETSVQLVQDFEGPHSESKCYVTLFHL